MTASVRKSRAVDWFLRDRNGHITLVQFPNFPLWIFFIATLVHRVVHDSPITGVAAGIATVAIVIWALMEIGFGVNPFRRLLGGVLFSMVMVSHVLSLVHRL